MLKYQQFTPSKIITNMLDRIDYTGDVQGKKVLESSCGTGNILVEIVERYIIFSIYNNYTSNEIVSGLENDIHAYEIDSDLYKICIARLNELGKKYNLQNVRWNLKNSDSLQRSRKIKYDYIVGNPPYIKYHDIDQTTREVLKHKYIVCSKGNFDYYYAFLEEDFNSLKRTGKLAYLIPSNMFKNVFADTLRDLIKPSLSEIVDFTQKTLFEGVLTSSSILILDKMKRVESIKYTNNTAQALEIKKSTLKGKWIFNTLRQDDSLIKFGNYFNASMSIATLLNEAYILKNYRETEKYIINNDLKIEKELVKEAASPRSQFKNKNEKIIFPYYYSNNKIIRYSPEDFENNFPYASKYLSNFANKLAKRSSSKNTHWFEFGRTQALKHLKQPKLLMSTIISKKVKLYELNTDTIPYSGIYIVPVDNLSLETAKTILLSKEFLNYAKLIATSANSNSLRITAKDINNFCFTSDLIN